MLCLHCIAAFAESDEQAITREAFEYLHQHGYINTGVLKGQQSAADKPVELRPADTAAGGLSDYELALKTFAILQTSDMEVRLAPLARRRRSPFPWRKPAPMPAIAVVLQA